MAETSRVRRGRGLRWEGVPIRRYKDDPSLFKEVQRQVLLGEGEGEQALSFVVRYFEVGAGGYSTLEHHEHPHAVIVLRGRGSVRLDNETTDIAPFDCVYVAPGTVHQFRGDRGETLGFLCVVDRVRDRPQALQ
ncbi:MAG: cupin domain-containing protein [Gemmatimonadota bacterium]|nr:cupin domain-containing protein [Gemmatimonadota bacterium]